MIKRFIKKYVSKYFTDINDTNISYSVLHRTIDLYNVSVNKEFLKHLHSYVSHVHYNFTLECHLVVINEMEVRIEDLSCLTGANASSQVSLEINELTVVYRNFSIKVKQLLNNKLSGVIVYHNNVKLVCVDDCILYNNTYTLKNLRGKYTEIMKLPLFDMKNRNVGNTTKYYANIRKLTVKGQFFYITAMIVSTCTKWSCMVDKFKYNDVRFRHTTIEYDNYQSIRLCNDLISASFQYGSVLQCDIQVNKHESGAGQDYTMTCIISALRKVVVMDTQLSLSICGYIIKCKLTSCRDIIEIAGLSVNNSVMIDKCVISDTLKLFNVRVNLGSPLSTATQIDIVGLVDVFVDCKIIAENVSFDEIFCKQVVLGTKYRKHIVMNTEDDYVLDYIRKLQLHGAKVVIEEIQMIRYRSKIIVDVLDTVVNDVEWCMQMYTKYANKNSNTDAHDIHIDFYNVQIYHKHISLILQYTSWSKGIACFLFDVTVGKNYFIEDSVVKLQKDKYLIKKLDMNISDVIMHMLHDSIDMAILPVLYGDTQIQIIAKYINIRLYESMNTEKFSIYFMDCFIKIQSPASIRDLSEVTVHLGVKFCQIDDQSYTSKHPIIFSSRCDNIFCLSLINNEMYIRMGKFSAFYDDCLINRGCIKNCINFCSALIKSSNNTPTSFSMKSIYIDKIEGFVFYRYPIDLKLKSHEIKNFAGNVCKLYETISASYKTMISSKLFCMVYKIVKNSFKMKTPVLAYKDDCTLPSINFVGYAEECRIRYPMPMRHNIVKYHRSLAVSYYIYNSLIKDNLLDEYFVDGTFARVRYFSDPDTICADRDYKEACLVLTTRRLMMSTRLNIKEVCLSDLSVNESRDYFCIGQIKVIVEDRQFISALCKFLCL